MQIFPFIIHYLLVQSRPAISEADCETLIRARIRGIITRMPASVQPDGARPMENAAISEKASQLHSA